LSLGAENGVVTDADAVETQQRCAACVHAVQALDLEAGRVARHQEERDARRVARRAGRPRRDDAPLGALPVEHVRLLAPEGPAAPRPLGTGLDVLVRVPARSLPVGPRAIPPAPPPPAGPPPSAPGSRRAPARGRPAAPCPPSARAPPRVPAPPPRPSGRSSRDPRRRTARGRRCRASRAAPSRPTARARSPRRSR